VHNARFAVIDTETTGLDPARDRVVSLAVVPIDGGAVRQERSVHILIDPGVPIPQQSTAIHGIADADVRGAPDLPAALRMAAPDLADRIVVGHNLPFDLAFLSRSGFAPAQTLDTRAISRVLWPQRRSRHSLDALAARVGVTPRDRHTALGDAVATAETLAACLPLLAARGLDSPAAVAAAYEAQQIRRARLRRSIRRRSIRHRTVLTHRSRPRRSMPRPR
jgi:DNA polymerase-3 subunit epsilon